MWRMKAVRHAVITGLLVMSAMPLVAQEREKVRVRQPMQEGQNVVWMTRRARLGVKVALQARDTDSLGAYVEGVTPGGPADKAGLRAGDVITKLDGSSLAGTSGGGDQSMPGMKLVELAARLDPNDTVKVEYRRGKDKRNTTLVTQEDPQGVFTTTLDGMRDYAFKLDSLGGGYSFNFRTPGDFERRFEVERDVDGMGPMRVFMSAGLEDLELVELNPDLGSYFGASDGVLVIRVPKDSPLGLRGGDVVLTVDGRKVTSTSQLHRILRTYDSNEAIRFEVLRNKRKETVNGKAPERQGLMKMRSREGA